MKYREKINEFVGDRGVIYGSPQEGFTFKKTPDDGDRIEEVGEDFVVLFIEKGDIQGYWYCPMSRFTIHTP